ncbi:MAG: Ig-like domain-containing protein [Chloroflexi bacterium]|nr:Ig-like domain-containing protein [Chloroflexota bacterium]
MASVAFGHYSPATLSAYHDEMLPEAEHREVSEHLKICPLCRSSMHELKALGGEIRTATAPFSVITPSMGRVTQRNDGRDGRRVSRLGLALIGVLTAAAFTWHQVQSLTAPTVQVTPASGNVQVPLDQAVTVSFHERVNRSMIASSLRVEPSIPFDVVWSGSSDAKIIPLVPWRASSTYTISAIVQSVNAGPVALTAPTTLTIFHTAPSGLSTSIAVAGTRVAVPASSASLPSVVVPSRDTPPRVSLDTRARAAASVDSHEAPSPLRQVQSAVTAVVSGRAMRQSTSSVDCVTITNPTVANVWLRREDIQRALGCQVQPAMRTSVTVQEYQRGTAMEIGAYKLAVIFSPTGVWMPVSFHDDVTGSARDVSHAGLQPGYSTVLGRAVGAPQMSTTEILDFASGFIVVTPTDLYILQSGGLWQVVSAPQSSAPSVPFVPRVTGGASSFAPMIAIGSPFASNEAIAQHGSSLLRALSEPKVASPAPALPCGDPTWKFGPIAGFPALEPQTSFTGWTKALQLPVVSSAPLSLAPAISAHPITVSGTQLNHHWKNIGWSSLLTMDEHTSRQQWLRP